MHLRTPLVSVSDSSEELPSASHQAKIAALPLQQHGIGFVQSVENAEALKVQDALQLTEQLTN